MLQTIQYYLFLIFLGTLPSLIWLSYYLKKDKNKEPKSILSEVFLLGGVFAFVALVLEMAFMKALVILKIECTECKNIIPEFLGNIDYSVMVVTPFFVILGLAFIEEVSKYFAAKIRVQKSKYFDEPIDAMIYLIVAGLGFAAVENIGYIATANQEEVFDILILRFFTATFLHTLVSGVVGYFFALSIIHKKSHLLYISIGIAIASFLHALFNFTATIAEETSSAIFYLILLLIIMWIGILRLFASIKKIHYNMQQQA